MLASFSSICHIVWLPLCNPSITISRYGHHAVPWGKLFEYQTISKSSARPWLARVNCTMLKYFRALSGCHRYTRDNLSINFHIHILQINIIHLFKWQIIARYFVDPSLIRSLFSLYKIYLITCPPSVFLILSSDTNCHYSAPSCQ